MSLTLQCQHCHSRFSLREPQRLKDGATSTCRQCGARFAFVIVPDGAANGDDAASGRLGTATFHVQFLGQGSTLFGIHVVNVCLTLLTLGVYYFWAKTRVRRYLFSQSEFAGDRFAYHGTGQELLLGLLRAGMIFGLPYLALAVGPELLGAGPAIQTLAAIAAGVVFFSFLPVALAGARRYRLSRTSWRGIRFSFRGRTWDFLKLFWKGMILTGVTLGAYYPFFDTQRQAFWVSHSYVGGQRFSFDGQAWDLAPSFVAAVLLFPFTLGLSSFWYQATRQRYFWDHTGFGQARFACTVTTWPLVRLKLGNLLLLVLTLGLAWPWTTVRNIRFLYRNLMLAGPVDLDRIRQEAQ
ncbi:MAG: YjgN family protein, partial [Nitrospirales bacterium]